MKERSTLNGDGDGDEEICLSTKFDGRSMLTFVGVSTLMERMHYIASTTFPNGLSKFLPRLQYLNLRLYTHRKSVPTKIPANLNRFNQLRELNIRYSYRYVDEDTCKFDIFLALARMLDACPCLHKFRLEIYSISRNTLVDGKKVRWRLSESEQLHHRHLKEVEISGLCPDRWGGLEVEVALYLIHNAVGLEQMIIDLWRDPHSLPTSEEVEVNRAAEELEMKRVHDVLINENPSLGLIVRDSSHSLFIPPYNKDDFDGSIYFSPMFND